MGIKKRVLSNQKHLRKYTNNNPKGHRNNNLGKYTKKCK